VRHGTCGSARQALAKRAVVDRAIAVRFIGLQYYEPGPSDEKNHAYLEPLPSGCGQGAVLGRRDGVDRPFASKVNSSMHTERRKEVSVREFARVIEHVHLPLNWTTEPCCVTLAACSITLPA